MFVVACFSQYMDVRVAVLWLSFFVCLFVVCLLLAVVFLLLLFVCLFVLVLLCSGSPYLGKALS